MISVTEAKKDKLFYVVANLVIVDVGKQKVLLLKRSMREKAFPGKWAFAGGKLEHKDIQQRIEELGVEPLEGVNNVLGELAQREAKEECGLEVSSDGSKILKNKVFIRPDNVPVMMVSIYGEYVSGEVVLEEDSFDDYAWVDAGDIDDYDRIDGSEQEILSALEIARSN
ncbi:MAG: NUDIX hydrolase [Patescibacteria group bacterium]